MSEWKKGDRVIIRPELAEGFCLPLRRFAKEGRAATVESIQEIRGRYSVRTNIRVLFDSRTGAKRHNFTHWLDPNDLAETPKE